MVIVDARPECDCTPAGDSAVDRPATLHQEHCAVFRWWWAQAIRLTCTRPSCKRVELVDLGNPRYTDFLALPEPRKVLCSKCAIENAGAL